MIDIKKELNPMGSVILVGGKNKSKLLDQLISLFKDSDFIVDVISSNTEINDVADKIHSYQIEMMNRIKEFEAHKLDNYKQYIIVVDNLTDLMMSSKYKAIDSIKNDLGSICRLGKSVGIFIVLVGNRASGQTFSNDILNNVTYRILVDDSDHGSFVLLFNEDYTMPFSLDDNMGVMRKFDEKEFKFFTY